MTYGLMTAPLIPGGTMVEWCITRESDGTQTFLNQSGAHLYHPAHEVVPFIRAAAQSLRLPPEDQHPNVLKLPTPVALGLTTCGDEHPPLPLSGPVPQRTRVGGVDNGPSDPLARRLWTFWAELMLRETYMRMHRGKRRSIALGISWALWYGGADETEVNASFRAYDHTRTPIPTFDIERCSLDALTDALLATARLAAITKAF